LPELRRWSFAAMARCFAHMALAEKRRIEHDNFLQTRIGGKDADCFHGFVICRG
jgi:hypothetical protein